MAPKELAWSQDFIYGRWLQSYYNIVLEFVGKSPHRVSSDGPFDLDEFASEIQSIGDWYKQFIFNAVFVTFVPHPLQKAYLLDVLLHYPLPRELDEVV
ncbi:hypothetical protein M427DRAFT_28277 [Gonapodya prolifera JEL478]|uniref:Uncharacterized protein n=1 Tax=Gonapodya prolifera (strain JEL478) TaxID=1344416 RepID=A0A139AV53_GONPJ|nr:hypothetical protein M427DRAFT_28277 [Gonapodya prolifera JEL478]|eukprot:KXS20587.1 hypothetical protein M427DRAFT_28277 [Gonapodya prolifera JEL478]